MYKVALAQVNSTDDLSRNLTNAIAMAEEAKRNGAQAILFPESFLFIGKESGDYRQIAEPLTGPLIQNFRSLARDLGIEMLLGGFAEASDEPAKSHNTALWIDDEGEIRGVYRKLHLFDAGLEDLSLTESRTVKAGSELTLLEHQAGPIGMTICYDLRFPLLFQRLRAMGAKVLLVPAAFAQQTGECHWRPLLRARAIENQCFVLAPAQTGWHNEERRSFGMSLAIDPWGRILAEAGTEVGLIYAELDLALIDQVREKMPVFSHRIHPIDYPQEP